MTTTTRRLFMMTVASSGCGLLAAPAWSQSPPRVDEADDNAVALGYKHDSSKVDAAKFPKHAATQTCAGCSFWQGAASDPWAGCAMFGRKQVANGGWCQAWAKKPG